MNEGGIRAGTLSLLGGRPSLDFANTVDWHASDNPVETLTSYSELVTWSVHAGILTERQRRQMLTEAQRLPADSTAVLNRAIALREAIYAMLSAVSHGQEPQVADLDLLNVEISRTLAQSRIVTSVDGFAWDWAGDEDALDRMLWTIVHDAADLLTTGDLARVGQCADGRCGWLFLDTSRNRSRRWCSMEDCGNRAKARRHYRRRRQEKAPS